MLAAGLSIEECVETIAAILPVDSMRGVAYWRMLISLIYGRHFIEVMACVNVAETIILSL